MDNNMPIKLIAMDMDGTLLNQDQMITKESIRAIEAAGRQGITVAICTGRLAEDASFFASDAGLEHIRILSMNGGYCLDHPHGQPTAIHYMKDDQVEKILDILDRSNRIYSVFGGNHIAVNRLFSSGKELKTWGSFIDRKGDITYTYGAEGIGNLRNIGVNKMVCIDREHPETLTAIRNELEQSVPGISITSSWADNIEIMPSQVDKGTAICQLAKELGISMEQVMVIGDYDNDISMLKVAGYGVCMANGSDNAKAVAKYTTLSNREDGVARAIWKYALGECTD